MRYMKDGTLSIEGFSLIVVGMKISSLSTLHTHSICYVVWISGASKKVHYELEQLEYTARSNK
jgi:hypothetical protein